MQRGSDLCDVWTTILLGGATRGIGVDGTSVEAPVVVAQCDQEWGHDEDTPGSLRVKHMRASCSDRATRVAVGSCQLCKRALSYLIVYFSDMD